MITKPDELLSLQEFLDKEHRPLGFNRQLRPGAPPVRCGVRPECAGCGYPAHGFVCHFTDGSCLRHAKPDMTEKEGTPDADEQ